MEDTIIGGTKKRMEVYSKFELIAAKLFTNKIEKGIFNKIEKDVKELIELYNLIDEAYENRNMKQYDLYFGKYLKKRGELYKKIITLLKKRYKKYLVSKYPFLKQDTKRSVFFYEKIINELYEVYLIVAIGLAQEKNLSAEETVDNICKTLMYIEKIRYSKYKTSYLAISYLKKLGHSGEVKNRTIFREVSKKLREFENDLKKMKKLKEEDIEKIYWLYRVV